MSTIKMPQPKPTIEKLTLLKWFKNQGDTVKKGDTLLMCESDEGLVELESAQDGVISQVLVPAGKTVAVNTPLAELNATGTGKVETKSAILTENKPMTTGTVTPIVMPKAGQSMEEGTITKWRVQPGATIKKGDVIFEIETDKATLEVEAVDEGRLARIVLPEGGCVKVLEPVAYLAGNDADVDAFIASQGTGEAAAPAVSAETVQAQASSPAVTAPAMSEEGRVKASPAARKIAGERGVNLATVATGSGPGGRILSTDIPAAGAASAAPAKREEIKITPVIEGDVIRKRMSGMRKAIARNLLASKQNIPHFYIRTTVVADQLFAFYQLEKAKYPCSLNDVVVMGCAKAIQEFPAFRSKIDKDKDEILEYANSNIGIAVGMDEGLVVPVMVGVEALTLKQIGSETKRLATAARSGKIEGMGKGIFTITNLGMFGVEEFAAIINPPEAAILAVGAARESVIVSGGTMRPGRVMTMTLSCDHRVIDGMLAAKFMARLKELLEYPQQLI
jgi:pyruvate dehydrogenase E2 component (dihydrolipoamide acetyltransferase)